MAIGALVETMKPSLSYYIGYAQKRYFNINTSYIFLSNKKTPFFNKFNINFFKQNKNPKPQFFGFRAVRYTYLYILLNNKIRRYKKQYL